MHILRPCVTVSVWNTFHSPHLVAGLEKAGFRVSYQDSTKCPKVCDSFFVNNPARLLNALARRRLLPANPAHSLARIFIDFRGSSFVKKTTAFWGWSGCSLSGLKAARAAGKPAILERGSSHCIWQKDCVAKEHIRLGLPLSELSNQAQLNYDLEEYKAADVICIPSRFVRDTFLDKGIAPEKLFVNPYGVDFPFWSAGPHNRGGEGPLTFLWVASLMPRKGIAILLEAWRKAALRDARLVLVGPVSHSVKPLLRHLPAGVEIKPALNYFGVRKEMSRAHAYVLPSFEEGMARSVLEAAAAGLAPMITYETGATDILTVDRDAWVLPAGNSDAWAETFREVAKAPDECNRRGKAEQEAVQPYSWEAYGQRAAELLNKMLTLPCPTISA